MGRTAPGPNDPILAWQGPRPRAADLHELEKSQGRTLRGFQHGAEAGPIPGLPHGQAEDEEQRQGGQNAQTQFL